MADWTTIGVGLVTATAALIGGLGGQHLQVRAERDRHARELRRQENEARQAAYLALLSEATKMLAIADGAALTGTVAHAASEDIDRFLHAATEAELRAPREAWAEMLPFLTVVQLRLNLVRGVMVGPMLADADAQLDELGGRDLEGLDQLRARFVAAVTRDAGTA